LKRALKILSELPMLVAGIALFGLMVMTFFDVVLRSTINAPIEAATELTRMAIAIVVFASLPVLSGKGQHISVDLTDGLFQRFRLTRFRDGAVALLCGVILLWPAERVSVLAERARSYGDQTEYLGIPTYPIAWFIAIMTFITAIVLILNGLLRWFAPRLLENLHD
jgi:TRAP-type C4-dicarboxylate transport system permease small subunit